MVSHLRVAQFNANSLLGHMDQVRYHFETNQFHLIAVSETWLHSRIPDDLLQIQGYYIIRNDREGKVGGGVACYVHNSLTTKILALSPKEFNNCPEFILLDVRSPKDDVLLFASIYRRPEGRFFDDFLANVTNHLHAYHNIIFAGDLNCNLLRDYYNSRYLRNFVDSLSLHLVHSEATFHTANANSLLDVIIVDNLDKVHMFSKSEAPFIAGHDLLEFSFNFDAPMCQAQRLVRRNYKKFNESEYLNTVKANVISTNIASLCTGTSQTDVDTLVSSIANIIIPALDTHAPLSTFRVSKPPAPWLTDNLKRRMKERDALYKRAKRTSNLLGFAIYRDVRDKLTADIRNAKSNFQYQCLDKITDPSKMWKELARLGLVKSNLSSPLHFFTPDQLNQYYASISNRIPPCTYEDFIEATPPHLIAQQSFTLMPTTVDIVLEHIVSSPLNSYANGIDGIPLFGIRSAFPEIAPFLTALFNKSIELSLFPSAWKIAIIRPLSKIASPLSPSDTRPIANLPEPSKILEKIVHQQIVKFIEDNNILDPRQSGYRRSYSTQTALLRVCDDVRKNIDDRRLTILILFDFSKAFDTVSHLRLLSKLNKLGFSPSTLAWIFSYLTGRSQTVVDEVGRRSRLQPLSSGVPQGSVLGPLLFSLFINDIASVLKYTNHMIFADDTQIYLSCFPSQLAHALQLIARDAEAISDYATSNGLSLNLSKSKVMILGSTQFVKSIDFHTLPPINVSEVNLPYVSEARNLGVVMMSDLSWRSHVSLVSQKVHYTLYRLKYHRNSLSLELKCKLVTTLVFPIIDYCCLVYHNLTDELDTKLQRLINCCVRFIFDLRRDEHISPFRHRLQWLSVKNRRLYFLGCYMYQVTYLTTPSYISDRFTRPAGYRLPRSAAPPSRYHIPSHRTVTYRNSFLLSAVYFWDSLPQTLVISPSLATFKRGLFAHLFLLETDGQVHPD